MMSRKRMLASPSETTSKRYLNAALAAELNALRISNKKANRVSDSFQNAFGSPVYSSPFLSSQHQSFQYPPQPYPQHTNDSNPYVSFGSDFTTTLQEVESNTPADNHYQPIISIPDSPSSSSASASSMAVDDEIINDNYQTSNPINDENDEQIMVYDITHQPVKLQPNSKINDNEKNENRLIIYEPPVKTNTTLKELHHTLATNRTRSLPSSTDEWLRENLRLQGSRTRMALVPWKSEHDRLHPSNDSVFDDKHIIPVPWHPIDNTNRNDQIQSMEIEEV